MLPVTPMLSNRNPQTSTFPTANLFQSNGDAFEADWTEISESESENSVKSDDRNLNFIDVKGSIESLLDHEIKNLSPPLVISTNNNSTLRGTNIIRKKIILKVTLQRILFR